MSTGSGIAAAVAITGSRAPVSARTISSLVAAGSAAITVSRSQTAVATIATAAVASATLTTTLAPHSVSGIVEWLGDDRNPECVRGRGDNSSSDATLAVCAPINPA